MIFFSAPARVSSATIRRDGAIYWSDQLNNSIGISYSQHNQHEFRYQSVRGKFYYSAGFLKILLQLHLY